MWPRDEMGQPTRLSPMIPAIQSNLFAQSLVEVHSIKVLGDNLMPGSIFLSIFANRFGFGVQVLLSGNIVVWIWYRSPWHRIIVGVGVAS